MKRKGRTAANGQPSRLSDKMMKRFEDNVETERESNERAKRANIRLELHNNRLVRYEVGTVTKNRKGYTSMKRIGAPGISLFSFVLIMIIVILTVGVVGGNDKNPETAADIVALQPTSGEWSKEEKDYLNTMDTKLKNLTGILKEAQPEHEIVSEYPEAVKNGAYASGEFRSILLDMSSAVSRIEEMDNVPEVFQPYHEEVLVMVEELELYRVSMWGVLDRKDDSVTQANFHLVSASKAMKAATDQRTVMSGEK